MRTINSTENSIYCEFDDPEGFIEYYDIASDPFNAVNLAFNATQPKLARSLYRLPPEAPLMVPSSLPAKLAWLHERVRDFMQCSGAGCWDPQPTKSWGQMAGSRAPKVQL